MEFAVAAVTLEALARHKSDALIVGYQQGALLPAGQQLNEATDGALARALQHAQFDGKAGQTLPLFAPPGVHAGLIVVVGLGSEAIASLGHWQKAVTAAVKALPKGVHKVLNTLAEAQVIDRDELACVTDLAHWGLVASYRFQAHKSKPAPAHEVKQILRVSSAGAAHKAALVWGQCLGTGVNFARDLGNQPPNVAYPGYLSEMARALGDDGTVSVDVLGENEMRELGMNALLSVAAGSAHEAQLAVMRYQGGKPKDAPVVLVGKGITFDSGGISLKPGAGMDEMKYDMCGAASVLGVMAAIKLAKLKLNVIGVIACAENMPSGTATRPGDIVTTMSGQTVEILNTDAEGRLVLCDALTYVTRFKPAAVIDVATLTGACVVALGKVATGLFSTHHELAQELIQAGQRSQDRAWQMPVWDDYQELLDSNFADMANIGGPTAGSITAACYLARFAKDYPWAHLDIAGTAWISGPQKGATGRPVPMLLEFLRARAG